MSTQRYFAGLCLGSALLLSACGGGGGGGSSYNGGPPPPPPPATYSVGGTVAGLATGVSVVLQNSGGNNTTVSANGSFSFATAVTNGTAYAVTVLTQPTGQICTVSAGSGTVAGANVTGVQVACVTNTYTISGTVTGLNTGAQVTVLNNTGNSTTVKANGAFSFTTPVTYNGSYAVTVATQPIAQVCTVTGGTGTVTANVSGVAVVCGPATELVIHSFDPNPDGVQPFTNTIQGADGNFYGTTYFGGTTNNGTVFKITPAGVETVLYSFKGDATDGGFPNSLIQGSDGNFYGTTVAGGTNFGGTVFKITPAGVETVLHSFKSGATDGGFPNSLIQGSDGNFYGTSSGGGPSGYGTVFKITPAGVESVLHFFAGGTTDGNQPRAAMIQGSDGNFYGTTYFGGTNGNGAVFKITAAGLEAVLYSFAGGTADGSGPQAAMIQGSDGNFYGTTYAGGTNNGGTVFKITPTGVETVLHLFTGGPTDGAHPQAALIQGSDGNFYGTALVGGPTDNGTVYKTTPAGVESVLYSFAGGTTDGNQPQAALILGSDGNFYGTTRVGGTNGNGTVYKITPAGLESVLYSFSRGSEGLGPVGLTQGSDGNFYGTTSSGGTTSNGAVFKITPAGVESVLYSFAGGTADGSGPQAALIQGSDGNFYGTTSFGGTSGNGTVFKITPAGVETVLHSFFTVGADGAQPQATLIQGSDGNFYGTTRYGGTSSGGTVFKITPAGVETVLYSFAGGTADGAQPQAALIQGSDGNFYGTTLVGGTTNNGTVFKITPAGVETVLYSFTGGAADGSGPQAALIQGSDGNFYGTTYAGGTNSGGTVFKITPAGLETVLHIFTGNGDGFLPQAALIQGSDGNFYGTTYAGGTNGGGTVFKITPAGVEMVLCSFTGGTADGRGPQTALIQGSDGIFYGTTSGGGSTGFGTVFKF